MDNQTTLFMLRGKGGYFTTGYTAKDGTKVDFKTNVFLCDTDGEKTTQPAGIQRFANRALRIANQHKDLIAKMKAHPDFGRLFIIHDPSADAGRFVADEDARTRAKFMALNIVSSNMPFVAALLGERSTNPVYQKKRILEHAERDPEGFQAMFYKPKQSNSYHLNKTEFTLALVKLALVQQVLTTRNNAVYFEQTNLGLTPEKAAMALDGPMSGIVSLIAEKMGDVALNVLDPKREGALP